MNFPDDVDGDVLRTLEENGFDFERVVDIDFIIDFDHWPLTEEENKSIKTLYPDCEFLDPDEVDLTEGVTNGSVEIVISSKLSYDLVVKTQEKLTSEMKPFGGWCDSWGVLDD